MTTIQSTTSTSNFRPPLLLRNPHLQTIFPALFRKGPNPGYRRIRMSLKDEDFLDLDCVLQEHNKVAILVHGLEGSASRNYMRGMASALSLANWDVVAVNLRGCSGELNRAARLYHAGETEDLHEVVEYVSATGSYKAIALVGFSLGGNIVLKYLGEGKYPFHPHVHCAATFSVPCDLAGSAAVIGSKRNTLYMRYFLKSLKQKVESKARQYPGLIDTTGLAHIHSFDEFDDRYTARLHGFDSALAYWTACSSKQFLAGVRTPTLILTALDDPFMSESCFPVDEASSNPNLVLEAPQRGGHLGFVARSRRNMSWLEWRAVRFFNRVLPEALL